MTRRQSGHSPASITHHLRGIHFPAGKEDLVRHAKKNGADDVIIEILNEMDDRQYDTMADVMKGLGEVE